MSVLDNIPRSAKEVFTRITQDIKNELSNTNPWFRNSLLRAQSLGYSNRIFDLYSVVRTAYNETDPFKATKDRLSMWGIFRNMEPVSANESSGTILITGTVGTAIPAATIYKQEDQDYSTKADGLIALISKDVSSLTVSGTVATVITTTEHNFGAGATVTITNAVQDAFNASWEISTVVAADQFEFVVPVGTPLVATGAIVASVDGVVIEVESVEKGIIQNLDNDVELTVETTISGANDTAVTTWYGIKGGLDDQTEEEYRDAVIYRHQNPLTNFNDATIEAELKKTPGITRVWVHRVTPEVGAVTIYFVRDNDDSIIPTANQVSLAKSALVNISNPETEVADIHVNDPLTGVPVNVTVTNIVPDSITMRNAVEESVKSFFRGDIAEGEDLDVSKLNGAIYQTYDVNTSLKIESFTLSQPAAGLNISMGEIAIEGITSVN
jgi:uncharacterized phage protein gp47/JayE